MHLLVVGDCHGTAPEVDEEASRADLILVTGDVCGDSDEMREAMFKSIDSEKKWYDILGREKARELVERSLDQGERVLKYLDGFGKPVLLVPGNWDWIGGEEWDVLGDNRFQRTVDRFDNVHNINRETVKHQKLCFVGYGPCSGPEVPQYEDERPESPEELEELEREYRETGDEISMLFKSSERPVILLSHNAPQDTSLDMIDNPDSPADGRHYGSLVVRDMIEEFSPVLSVAGHIHEGKGHEKVEGVDCINAGLHSFAEVTVEKGEIREICIN